MTLMSPIEVARALFWIREAQDHVNSCAEHFADPESFQAAAELQKHIDAEWDRLGPLVEDRPRPPSLLRDLVSVRTPVKLTS